jgi:hypothetical protein
VLIAHGSHRDAPQVKVVQQALTLIVTRRCRYAKESKVLFKVAGFADAQRRREATAAGGALTCLCILDLRDCGSHWTMMRFVILLALRNIEMNTSSQLCAQQCEERSCARWRAPCTLAER